MTPAETILKDRANLTELAFKQRNDLCISVSEALAAMKQAAEDAFEAGFQNGVDNEFYMCDKPCHPNKEQFINQYFK